MAPHVAAALGEHRVNLVLVLVQGNEHARVGAPVDVELGGLRGVEQDPWQVLELQAARAGAGRRSTRSVNMTSPSSVRWTGHLAAMVVSRSACSAGRSAGNRST